MKKLLMFMILSLCGLAARADYSAALEALRKKEHTVAEQLLLEAAEKGDARGWNALGLMRLEGLNGNQDEAQAIQFFEKAAAAGNVNALKSLIEIYGKGTASTPKNVDRARDWAWKFATGKNAYAAFAFYELTVNNELSVLDERGRFNRARYDALANRSMQDRELDVRAFSMLSFAAERGYAPAVQEAQKILLSLSGQNADDRSVAFDNDIQEKYADKLSNQALAQLDEQGRKRKSLQRLGQTYASVNLYNQVASALVALADLNESACDRSKIKVMHFQVIEPMRAAEYLPVSAHLLDDVLLVKGRWKELWTVNACGKTMEIPLKFEADGWMGARFAIDSSGFMLANE